MSKQISVVVPSDNSESHKVMRMLHQMDNSPILPGISEELPNENQLKKAVYKIECIQHSEHENSLLPSCEEIYGSTPKQFGERKMNRHNR